MRPAQQRTLAAFLLSAYRVSISCACRVLCLHRSEYSYLPRKQRADEALAHRIEEIARVRIRYGFARIFTLLRREGWPDNHKRVHRIYKQQNLGSKRPRPAPTGEPTSDAPTPELVHGLCC